MAKSSKKSQPAVKEKAPPTPKIRQRQQMRKGAHGGMQLVLIEDVTYLGKQGDMVEVKPGYGRNYLLPNGLAVVPSVHNLQMLERHKIRVHQARESRIADLKVLADQIARQEQVTIESNSNDEGHLYGSVGPIEVSRALKGKNLNVDPEMVKLDDLIKECGVYPEIRLSLGYDIESKIKVMVIPQATARK